MFPNISLGAGETLKFDRILADVPCSGDGTLRKNLEIWNKWSPSDGNSLHVIQLKILDRAMNMLKPGGRLVYSTCSFNPAENEAVVAAGLNAHPGEFTIVDVAEQLPNLKRRPGITTWKVGTRPQGKEARFHESFESYRESVDAGNESEKDKDKGVPKTVWPPANAGELNLERCLRLLPHDQNTGGFFVCVLEKKAVKSEVPSNVEKVDVAAIPQPDDIEATDEKGTVSLKRQVSPSAEGPEAKKAKPSVPQSKKEKRDLNFREDPFSFVDPAHEEVERITKWFHLEPSFPSGNLLVRNEYGNPLRTVYIVNDVVKAVVQNNDYTRLRMISAGVKTFIRQDSQQRTDITCKWRVSSDGVFEVLKHVPEDTIIPVGLDEFRLFLEEMYPPIEKFSGAFREVCEKAELGNMIVRFNAGEGAGGKLALPLVLPVWKAKQSMSLLVDKREKSVLSERVFGADICKPAPPRKDFASVPVTDASAAPSGTATPAVADEEEAVASKAEDVDEEAAMNAA